MKPNSLILLAFLAWMAWLPSGAAEFLSAGKPFKESATWPKGQKAKNLYAVAGDLSVEGPVQGDLCAAGGRISVMAPVQRNLEALGGSVDLESRVGGNVRMAVGRLEMDGLVDGDLVAAARHLEISSKARIQGDIVLAGQEVTVAGTTRGRAWIAGYHVRLEGFFQGKTEVYYDQDLVLGPDCRLQGKLECYGPRPPETPAGFSEAAIDYHPTEALSARVASLSRWTAVFGLPALFRLAAWLLAAWVFGRLFPGVLAGVLKNAEAAPGKVLGAGFLVLAAGLVGIPVLFLSVVGGYLGLMATALFSAAMLTARLLAVFYLAFLLRRLLEKKRETTLPFRWPAGGILVLHLTGLFPWLGWAACFVLSLSALGAMAQLVFKGAPMGARRRGVP